MNAGLVAGVVGFCLLVSGCGGKEPANRPPRADAGADRVSATFIAPEVLRDGEDLAFRLVVRDAEGATAEDTVAIHVRNVPESTGDARFVILFIGDGMQLAHEIAASRYWTGHDDGLAWHAFPARAPCTTWDVTTYERFTWTSSVPRRFDPFRADPVAGYDPALGGLEWVAGGWRIRGIGWPAWTLKASRSWPRHSSAAARF